MLCLGHEVRIELAQCRSLNDLSALYVLLGGRHILLSRILLLDNFLRLLSGFLLLYYFSYFVELLLTQLLIPLTDSLLLHFLKLLVCFVDVL